MKHLRFLFMLFILMLGIQHSYGAIGKAQIADNYYCGFKTQEEFNQWTVIMADNQDDFKTWQWNSEDHYVECISDLGMISDDWLISPLLGLSGNKSHFIKMKLVNESRYEQPVIFTMGKDKTVLGQTETLLDTIIPGYSIGYAVIKVPATIEPGDYYFGIRYRGKKQSGWFDLHSFYLTESAGVTLSGVVSNSRDKILANAQVSLSGDKYKEIVCNTDEAGNYKFSAIDAGEYHFTVKADGNTTVDETITVGGVDMDHAVVMQAFTNFDVTGRVLSEGNIPVKSAVVTLTGELSYTTLTDDKGNFVIKQAREYNAYKLKVEKDLKVTHTGVVTVYDGVVSLGDIVMQTRVSNPANIKAQEIDGGAILSWMLPLKAKEIRYDSGIHSGVYSISDGNSNSVIGNVFDVPVVVNGMSWMAVGNGEASMLVDLYVFALNKDGSVSNNILFSVKGVESINYKYDDNYVWNEYSFPEEIEAPYGCMLAVGYSGELKLLYDRGSDEGYPNMRKGYYAYNYMEGFLLREREGNFFVRLSGSPLGVPQLAPGKMFKEDTFRCMPTDLNASLSAEQSVVEKANAEPTGTVTYKAWRLKAEDKENQDAWVALNLEDHKSLTYLDRAFGTLSQGIYQYALQVIYPEGQESDIRFSNELEYKLRTNVTFDISSNIGADFADGTTVTLVNLDNQDLNYTVVSAGPKVKFEQIAKGMYSLKATKRGFNSVTINSLDLTSQDAYFMGPIYPIAMNLVIKNPFNLKTEQKENSMDVTFRWNTEEGISEGFEDMADFAVNPAGELGWTYVDADGKETYGVDACKESPYPNMYAKMAFMAFNPSQTNPDLLDILTPYSGDKILVSVAALEGANDDYLFSPALSFESDFVLSFYAKSGFFADLGNEEFMVGYCRETASPQTVEWITAKPQAVGAAWTEFSYDIPKEAKFITIRCVSNQKFFFMLDDIYVGYKQSFADQLAVYEVYLDEELLAKTNKSEVVFPSLSKGKHLAKVQAIYFLMSGTKSYSDFVEVMFTVNEYSSIEEASRSILYAYNVQSGVITFDDQVTKVTVYDVQGKLVASGHESELNVSGWANGLYIFELKTNDQVSYCKIVVRAAR